MILISIHAPLAGCDDMINVLSDFHMEKFQSTHPLRGATRLCFMLFTTFYIFQSTHPLRGATKVGKRSGSGLEISIHAPLAGCDATSRFFTPATSLISIHAPLAGCDLCPGLVLIALCYFNPRTPCGVRHLLSGRLLYQTDFNPRTPCGVRRCQGVYGFCNYHFNPRTPCGVRRVFTAGCGNITTFQSTHPLRGATEHRFPRC